jgi:hypothetical protein
LGDEGDLAAQRLRVPAAERLAVDVDVAVAGLVEPGDELDERGLRNPRDRRWPPTRARAAPWPGGNPRNRLRVSRAAERFAPAMNLRGKRPHGLRPLGTAQ